MDTWQEVLLSDVLTKTNDWTDISPDRTYRLVTVRLWGKGVVLRSEVEGSAVSSARQRIVHSGQFILSRIDARNGALGLVPVDLDGAIVSNDFPSFHVDQERLTPAYLDWMSKTEGFVQLCQAASEGTTNRVRLQEDRFLAMTIFLPPLVEQQRIVARIDALAARIEAIRSLHDEVISDLRRMLLSAYNDLVTEARFLPMSEVAPIVRRPVAAEPEVEYSELGIRSFGNGTFHKSPKTGLDLGSKRIFQIQPGDLLFSNVFAWEGAIAVAQPEDAGRVGSHRFISCVPKPGLATSEFLRFHFLTSSGLMQIGEASPGGAGRNRTLGLDKLERLLVPVPAYEKQLWFDSLQAKVDAVKRLQAKAQAELDALLPSVLDRAFRGEL